MCLHYNTTKGPDKDLPAAIGGFRVHPQFSALLISGCWSHHMPILALSVYHIEVHSKKGLKAPNA